MLKLKWRTLRRGLVIGLASGLVLYLAFLVYGRVRLRRAEAAFARTFGTLDLASFERQDPPRSENAAEWLQAGAQAVFLDEKGVARIVDDNRCALDIMHRASAAAQTSYRIRYGRGMNAEIPSAQALRTAAALLSVEAQMALEHGDAAAASTPLKALSRLATSLEGEPLVITLLTGIGGEQSLLQVLSDVSARPNGARSQADVLGEARGMVPVNDLGVQVQKAFAIEGLALSKAFADGEVRLGDARPLAFIGPFRDLVRAAVLDECVAQASLSESAKASAMTDRNQSLTSRLPHVRLAAILLPSSLRMRDLARHMLARRHLVGAALALRSLAAAGGYPDSLPAELRHPEPVTGRPLAYTLRPDGSAELSLESDVAGVPHTRGSLDSIVLPASESHTSRR